MASPGFGINDHFAGRRAKEGVGLPRGVLPRCRGLAVGGARSDARTRHAEFPVNGFLHFSSTARDTHASGFIRGRSAITRRDAVSSGIAGRACNAVHARGLYRGFAWRSRCDFTRLEPRVWNSGDLARSAGRGGRRVDGRYGRRRKAASYFGFRPAADRCCGEQRLRLSDPPVVQLGRRDAFVFDFAVADRQRVPCETVYDITP